ncbi:MAG: RNA pseudouridine synthase [Pseudomonadota bacterium]|nr:RNA pseudouridine synthase [Pseudomonadota bacterium]
MTADDILARVLHRDGLILVIDKPWGVAVHRGPKGGESLEDSFDALRFGLPRKPALAHRLDRETSGCLVLGRHHKALEKLGKLFKQGKIGKTYWAIVEGGPAEDEGLIDKPLGRRDPDRGWWKKVDAAGQPSQTRWRVRGRGSLDGARVAWLEMAPLTGRTHQLRVHAASEGWPIVGDAVYGAGAGHDRRLHLHARRVEIPLGPAKSLITVEAPPPPHMEDALAACGYTFGAPAACQPAPDSAKHGGSTAREREAKPQ